MPWGTQISKVISLKVSLKCCEQDSGTMEGGVGFKYETKYQAFKLS